jgi:hypothetical protein
VKKRMSLRRGVKPADGVKRDTSDDSGLQDEDKDILYDVLQLYEWTQDPELAVSLDFFAKPWHGHRIHKQT